MPTKKNIFPVALLIVFFFCSSCSAQTDIRNFNKEKEGLTVSVYSNDLSLIRDVRTLNIEKGNGELKFDDIPDSILPETVNVTSLTDPEGFNVIRQEYDYDLISPDKLLDDHVGKQVKLISFNEYQDRKETVEAELLSNKGSKVYRIGNEIYLGYPGYVILPDVPENFTAKPELFWVYESKKSGDQMLEVTYLTRGMSWDADYIFSMDKEERSASIVCWATINNKSGTVFRDSRVRIVAGDVRQETSVPLMKARYAMDTVAASGMNESAGQRSFFEYHIYDVPGQITLENNKSVQAKLFSSNNVQVRKVYETHSQSFYYNRSNDEEGTQVPVNVILKLDNKENNGLGVPFPGGIVRVYKKDEKMNTGFIGEDRIKDTSKDEKVEVSLGTAFDIKVLKKQTEYKQLAKNLYETSWEITIRNNKDEDVTVNLYESLQGNWTVIDKNMPYEKVDSSRIKFKVDVPSGKEVTVVYRVKTGLG